MERLVGYRRIFSELSDAEHAARPYLELTADPAAYAELHLDLSAAARPSDYAILFHLNKIVNRGTETKVFDLGGCVGNLYYSYLGYLDHPERLNWVVNDLPEILKHGERIARERPAARIQFSSSLDLMEDCEVLLVSGALHYFRESLREMLERLSARPKHILINRTPLTDSPRCATVQDANGFLMPCWLWNRRDLIEGLRTLGYEVVDEWDVPELSLKIPFCPDRSVSAYSGLYLHRPTTPEVGCQGTSDKDG